MYICLCHAVTDNSIKEAINNGAASVTDLMNELNVATRCGCCLGEVARLVESGGKAYAALPCPADGSQTGVQMFYPASALSPKTA
ncbi:MAG: hypothetical protein CR975_03365 [Gammaproteobacteria bacterium]|nr:MAG: hypothetical protein CR975_03365 [Gammaproteobacteria bacterium]